MIAVESSVVMPPLLVVDIVVSDDDNASTSSPSESETGRGILSHSDSEPNQEKDSGIECNPDVLVIDEETASKIRQAVEFYLSDANILKDSFLLKHVRRSKDGYVSLKLISSFRKLRSLCRNWKAVALSLQNSDLLALNSDGTKVRRIAPLPDCDKVASSKTVIVYGQPTTKISPIIISELFVDCGNITKMEMRWVGEPVPVDLKPFVLKNPEVQSLNFCKLQFVDDSGAKKALSMDEKSGFRVILLEAQEKSTSREDQKKNPSKESPKKKKKRSSWTNSKLDLYAEDSEDSISIKRDHRRSSSGSVGYWSSGSPSSSGYLSSSPRENYYNRRHSYNPGGSQSENSYRSFAMSRDGKYNHKDSKEQLNKNSDSNLDLTLSPWRRRREQMMRAESSPTASSSTPLSNVPVPVVVVRSPRGPDGTLGFQSRTKSRLPSTAE